MTRQNAFTTRSPLNLVLRLLVLLGSTQAPLQAQGPWNASKQMTALLHSHCLDCHNQDITEGEFSLQSMVDGTIAPELLARSLERIHERVTAGEMPPADASRLSDADRQQLAALLDDELGHLSERFRNDPGDVAIARLTPYEYRNAIRDLSGGIVENAGRLLPNEGGAGEGFSNVGAAQVMTLPQYEKYMDAAKDALSHLRVFPLKDHAQSSGAVWTSHSREAVHSPSAARKEVVDEIITWHVGQQQKWGEEHRNHLERELGFVHAAYLEAAWRYANRASSNDTIESFAWISSLEPNESRIALAPSALRKWLHILQNANPESPHADWAAAWRTLAAEKKITDADLRKRCISIVAGNDHVVIETEDYAPPYEISFHEAREEVLRAAEHEGRWPFRIELGDAKELFLIVTDAGDGNRGEYAVWRRGRFLYKDGSSKPWQEAVTILGARSGNVFPFGVDGEKSQVLSDDAIGAKPPGALKFAVPQDAIVFEVDLTLDANRTEIASIQALVSKTQPKSSSYIPGRFVFGGKKRPVTAGAKLKEEQERALRKRNVAEANKTKIGLNAERNVFAHWNRTPLEAIGGPWPDQEADKAEPEFPYFYTVDEVRRNATTEDLMKLARLEDRLVSITDPHDEDTWTAHARELILPFARKAWRRDISEKEAMDLCRLYQEARSEGLSFDSAVKSSLLLVLSSPHFIYKHLDVQPSVSAESIRDNTLDKMSTAPLSSHALASRLAFFLWGSLPDAELLELARSDALQDVTVLSEQARRMLRDPKARSLARDFAGQLWDFSDFANFSNPDPVRFAAFTPELRTAMLEEVELFLSDVFQNNQPITRVLDADYTFGNAILAQHYGVEPPTHDDSFRRITLGSERGGLATMGLFLTKNSQPLRTSPVQRGVWLMESLLGRHLPSPPANVPALSEDETNSAGESIRQQLERHRAHATCATCHDKIDPLGISLEHFDAIGRWRASELDGSELSTTTQTLDGVTIEGSAGLRRYLITHQDEFVLHFNRKLLGYALGRSVHVGDRELLDRIHERMTLDNYRFSIAVEEIVSSPQFRTRRYRHE